MAVLVSLTIIALLFIRDGLTGLVVKQLTVHSFQEQVWELDARLEESVTRTRIENFSTVDYPLAAASLDQRDVLEEISLLDNRRLTINDAPLSLAFPIGLAAGDTIALHLRKGDPGTIFLCLPDAPCANESTAVPYTAAEGWYNITLQDGGSAFSVFFPDKVQVNRIFAYRVINSSYDIENRSYPARLSFETPDIIVPNLLRWDTLAPEEQLNGQAIGYSYSADSGQSWKEIADFNLSSILNTIIRIRATLASDGSGTPEVDSLSLGYWITQTEEREYTITPSLQYRSGTSFDRDNDGIENLSGVVDFQVAADFSWAVDTSTLCTRYWIQPVGNDSSFICSGAASCCAFVDLAAGLPRWNDPLHIFVGRYGAGRNNTIRAQVLSVGTGDDIFSSEWVNRSAAFLPAAPACTPSWTCAAYGPCIDRIRRCTAVADANACGISPLLPLNASCMPYAAQIERSEDIVVYSFFNNDNASLRVQLQQGDAALDIRTGDVVNGTIAVANYTENVKEIPHTLPSLGRYVDIVADPATAAEVSSATLRISYTDAEVSAAGLNESSLAIYYLDEDTEEWVTVDSAVNTTGNYVTAFLEHISFYGIFGKPVIDSPLQATDAGAVAEPPENTTGAAQPAGFQAEAEQCTYDLTIDAPSIISFVEERSQEIYITNTGCPFDTLSITVDDPLHLLKVREESLAGIDEDEHITVTIQANRTVPVRQEFPIQSYLTKSVEKHISNYTAGLVISANAGGKAVVVKEAAFTAQIITPTSREPLTVNRTVVLFLLGITVAGSAGGLYWYWKKRRQSAL